MSYQGYNYGRPQGQYPPAGQYPPQGNYPPPGQYPPQGNYPPQYPPKHHHGGYKGTGYSSGGPGGYPQPGYPQPGYAQQPAYAQQPFTRGQQLPDSAHEHGLSYEPSHEACKVCHRVIAGSGYVCHQCPLVLCYDCANAIFYGNKAKQVHPHALALRVRNAWKCDLCHQHFKNTASFYCRPCDFDACSRCYVGF